MKVQVSDATPGSRSLWKQASLHCGCVAALSNLTLSCVCTVGAGAVPAHFVHEPHGPRRRESSQYCGLLASVGVKEVKLCALIGLTTSDPVAQSSYHFA